MLSCDRPLDVTHVVEEGVKRNDAAWVHHRKRGPHETGPSCRDGLWRVASVLRRGSHAAELGCIGGPCARLDPCWARFVRFG